MEYHVFKKIVKGRGGRQVRRRYYDYLDQNGKQIQKSCGKEAAPPGEPADPASGSQLIVVLTVQGGAKICTRQKHPVSFPSCITGFPAWALLSGLRGLKHNTNKHTSINQ
jgi:hypothetical protein